MLLVGQDAFYCDEEAGVVLLVLDNTTRMQLVEKEMQCNGMSTLVGMVLLESFVVSLITHLLLHFGNGAPVEIPLAESAEEKGTFRSLLQPRTLNAAFDQRAGRLQLWADGMKAPSTRTETNQKGETHE